MAYHRPPGSGSPDAWSDPDPRPDHDHDRGYAPTDERPPAGGSAYSVLPFPLEGPGVDPEPPPRRQWRIRLLAIAVAFTVVALAGGGAVLLLKRSAEEPVADATPPPAAGADLPEPGTPSPGAAPESSADPRFAEVGQCVRNDGMVDGQPKLLITECAPKTYEVLRRFDEATSGGRDAEAKCAGVEGYTNWYFYDSDLDTLDFVLCLKLR